MAANTANRETARDALTALFTAALVGAGKPVQAVYGYQASDFDGQSPVVVVLSSGVYRMRYTLKSTRYKSFFNLEVIVFVADAISDDSWTDANVEDKLDEVEKEIADVLADNRFNNSKWSDIRMSDEGSQILPANVGGDSYKMEVIPIIAEVIDG